MGWLSNGWSGGDAEDDGDEWTSSCGVVGDNVSVKAKGWGGLGGNESVVVLIMDEVDEFGLVEVVLEGASGVEMDEFELEEFNGV